MGNGSQDSINHDCLGANTDSYSIELNICYRCIICHLKHVIEQLPTGLARTMSRQVCVVQAFVVIDGARCDDRARNVTSLGSYVILF